MTVSSLARKGEESFVVLALDEILLVLAEIAKKAKGEEVQKKVYEELAHIVIAQLDSHISGYCLNGVYGYDLLPFLDQKKGIFFSLEEKMIEQDPLSVPLLLKDWTVTHAYQNLAGSKLELYYHPQEKQAQLKRELISELSQHCHMLGIDFIMELHILTQNGESYLPVLLESLKHFRGLCDAFIITPNTETMASITITAELDVPWLYNQTTTSYTKYKNELRLALEGGAAGCFIGQSILSGISRSKSLVQNLEEVKKYIKAEVSDRVIEIERLVSEPHSLGEII